MEFHLIKNGNQEGPFTIEELSQQGITPESEVWAPGMADWMQAGDVPVTYADSEALECDYCFTPKIGIREGLRAFVEWYKNYYSAK